MDQSTGILDVGDGHHIAWETCGNHKDRPAVVLHGGPGSGRSRTARQLFDLTRWRVVFFDQRGCGESSPHAADQHCDLSAITTAHLVADIEKLRRHLGVKRWTVVGGSWGSTLALAYAQAHPDRVTGLVLYSVATTTAREIAWITDGVGRFFPEAHARFRAGVPGIAYDDDVIDAYHAALMSPDPTIHHAAAQNWCDWEQAIMPLQPGQTPHPRWSDGRFRLCFARLVTHVWRHRAWLADHQLLNGMATLSDIPGVLIHGRLDFGSPLATPWQLQRAWPGSRLVIVETAGHGSTEIGMPEAIARSIAQLAAT
jgi:proline iminopeptidase